jgi:hypothetical protein
MISRTSSKKSIFINKRKIEIFQIESKMMTGKIVYKKSFINSNPLQIRSMIHQNRTTNVELDFSFFCNLLMQTTDKKAKLAQGLTSV